MPISELWKKNLPLQSETCFFILLSVLDIVWTNILMRQGAMEANPIAAYFFYRWNFSGLIGFKMALVAVICVIAQVIARRNLAAARGVMCAGITIVGAVVVYSAWLYWRHAGGILLAT